jgi:hypothetical protein
MFIKASFILLAVLGGLGETSPSHSKPLPHPTIDEIQWPLGRGGEERIRLAIPRAYGSMNTLAQQFYAAIQKKHRKYSAQVYEALLIRAIWPDLEPGSPDAHEFNLPRAPGAMGAILTSGAVETFKGEQFDGLQAELHSAIILSTLNLCISEEPPRNCYRRNNADVKPSKFGLQRVGVDFSKYPDFPDDKRSGTAADDIYFQRNPNGELITIILCTAEEAKTAEDGPQYQGVAHCEQKFVTKRANALVSVTYSRLLLKDWSLIQARWDNLLNSFVSKTSLAGEGK